MRIKAGCDLRLCDKIGTRNHVEFLSSFNIGADGDCTAEVFSHEKGSNEEFTDILLVESGADAVGEDVCHWFDVCPTPNPSPNREGRK